MSDSPAFVHRILDDNIHEFILAAPTRRAVDEMLAVVDALNSEVAKSGANPHRYILLDTTKGIPPINYTFAQLRPIIRKYPTQKATVAMISQPNFLLTTINIMMRAISSIRFYKPDEREQALAWLREEAAARR